MKIFSLALLCACQLAKMPSLPQAPATDAPAQNEATQNEQPSNAPLAATPPGQAIAAPKNTVTYFKFTDARGVASVVDNINLVPEKYRAKAVPFEMPMGDSAAQFAVPQYVVSPQGHAPPPPGDPNSVDDATINRVLSAMSNQQQPAPNPTPPGPDMQQMLQKAEDNVSQWQAKQNQEQVEIQKVMKSMGSH